VQNLFGNYGILSLFVIIHSATGEDWSWIILRAFCLVFEALRRWLW